MSALLWLSKYYSLLSQVVCYVTVPISFLRQLLFLPGLNYFILFFICIISLTFNSLSQIIFYIVKQRVYQCLSPSPPPTRAIVVPEPLPEPFSLLLQCGLGIPSGLGLSSYPRMSFLLGKRRNPLNFFSVLDLFFPDPMSTSLTYFLILLEHML